MRNQSFPTSLNNVYSNKRALSEQSNNHKVFLGFSITDSIVALLSLYPKPYHRLFLICGQHCAQEGCIKTYSPEASLRSLSLFHSISPQWISAELNKVLPDQFPQTQLNTCMLSPGVLPQSESRKGWDADAILAVQRCPVSPIDSSNFPRSKVLTPRGRLSFNLSHSSKNNTQTSSKIPLPRALGGCNVDLSLY